MKYAVTVGLSALLMSLTAAVTLHSVRADAGANLAIAPTASTALAPATVAVAPSAPIADPAAAPAPLSPVVASTLSSGSFVNVDQAHPTRGTARIVSANGQRYLEFAPEFDTATGPDVQIIFYRGNTVPVQVREQDYVTLASLSSFSGAQRYAIPASLNLADFGAIAIWCRQFNVTFGYVAL